VTHAKISCPSCATPVPAEDLELSMMLAKCSACDTVFSFAEEVGRTEGDSLRGALGARPAHRPGTPTDHPVKEHEDGDGLVLSWRWFSPRHLFLGFFALFWNGFLVVWYTIGISAVAAGDDSAVMMLCFPGIHVLVGLGVGYMAITGVVNSTTVRITQGRLAVEHHPLPWPGAKELHTDSIAQLFVKQRIKRGKNGTTVTYEVLARDRSHGEVTLMKGIAQEQAARYLEHRIEQWLGIEDQAVAGEHL